MPTPPKKSRVTQWQPGYLSLLGSVAFAPERPVGFPSHPYRWFGFIVLNLWKLMQNSCRWS